MNLWVRLYVTVFSIFGKLLPARAFLIKPCTCIGLGLTYVHVVCLLCLVPCIVEQVPNRNRPTTVQKHLQTARRDKCSDIQAHVAYVQLIVLIEHCNIRYMYMFLSTTNI